MALSTTATIPAGIPDDIPAVIGTGTSRKLSGQEESNILTRYRNEFVALARTLGVNFHVDPVGNTWGSLALRLAKRPASSIVDAAGYGVVGYPNTTNMTVDSTSALNAAVSDAYAAGGLPVVLPPGYILVGQDPGIQMRSGVFLDGNASILWDTRTGFANVMGATPTVSFVGTNTGSDSSGHVQRAGLRNLRISGPSQNANYRTAILCKNASHLNFYNVETYNAGYGGLYGYGLWDSTFVFCRWQQAGATLGFLAAPAMWLASDAIDPTDGLRYDTNSLTFWHNTWESNYGSDLWLVGAHGQRPSQHNFIGSKFEANGSSYAFPQARFLLSLFRGVRFTDCQFNYGAEAAPANPYDVFSATDGRALYITENGMNGINAAASVNNWITLDSTTANRYMVITENEFYAREPLQNHIKYVGTQNWDIKDDDSNRYSYRASGGSADQPIVRSGAPTSRMGEAPSLSDRGSGTAFTLNLCEAQQIMLTATGDLTLTISGGNTLAAGRTYRAKIGIKQDATGGRVITSWSASGSNLVGINGTVISGVGSLDTTANAVTLFDVWTPDGGVNIYFSKSGYGTAAPPPPNNQPDPLFRWMAYS